MRAAGSATDIDDPVCCDWVVKAFTQCNKKHACFIVSFPAQTALLSEKLVTNPSLTVNFLAVAEKQVLLCACVDVYRYIQTHMVCKRERERERETEIETETRSDK